MKKIYVILAMVFLSFGLSACNTLKYAECIARDRTSNPCN